MQVPNHADGSSVCYPLLGPHKHFVDRYEPGIRTYSVVPLNEECGLIEWVRNTIPIRNIFKTLYDRRNLTLHVSYEYCLFVLTNLLRYLGKGGNRCGGEGKNYERRGCSKTFRRAGLNLLPPYISRMVCRKVPRTYAMVSKQKCVFSDGCRDVHGRLYFGVRRKSSHTRDISNLAFRLGDRHCENIMMDDITGDTVHCDFNCLFERVSDSLNQGFMKLTSCIAIGKIL